MTVPANYGTEFKCSDHIPYQELKSLIKSSTTCINIIYNTTDICTSTRGL